MHARPKKGKLVLHAPRVQRGVRCSCNDFFVCTAHRGRRRVFIKPRGGSLMESVSAVGSNKGMWIELSCRLLSMRHRITMVISEGELNFCLMSD